jgi:hypothetical protein
MLTLVSCVAIAFLFTVPKQRDAVVTAGRLEHRLGEGGTAMVQLADQPRRPGDAGL